MVNFQEGIKINLLFGVMFSLVYEQREKFNGKCRTQVIFGIICKQFTVR